MTWLARKYFTLLCSTLVIIKFKFTFHLRILSFGQNCPLYLDTLEEWKCFDEMLMVMAGNSRGTGFESSSGQMFVISVVHCSL